MENSKNKYRLFAIVLFIGFTIAGVLLTILYNDNKNLENQVLKRENLIKKTVVKDKLLSTQKTKSDSIIERYINDCGIMIDGKKVSTDELLKYLHSQNQEINNLKNININLNDSLSVYKAYTDMSKSTFNLKYSVQKQDNKIVSSMTSSTDSLKIYKKLYESIKRDYGIIYKLENQKNKTIFSREYSKADSALYLYKYYKHVLSGDSLGNITIQLPTEKEIKRINKLKNKK